MIHQFASRAFLLTLWLCVWSLASFAQDASSTASNSSANNSTVTPSINDDASISNSTATDAAATDTTSTGELICVIGAGGTPEYSEAFAKSAVYWQDAARSAKLTFHKIGAADAKNDREQLQQLIEKCKTTTDTPLWLVMLGHGTFDQKTAKFNLRGRDVSATELKSWLTDCQRPLVIINCSSSSGPFLNELQGKDRVVITATSSGAEYNYARFGGYLAESLNDLAADLDHDDQVSLLEAYLLASSKVIRFYEQEARLATEHALLEDNHDGKGTPADFFVGIRAQKSKTGKAPDGRTAHRYILVPSANAPKLTAQQTQDRDRIENEIETLRDRKSSLGEEAYYAKLEELMVQLAKIYQAAD